MTQEPHNTLSTIYGSEKNASVLQNLIRMYTRPMIGSAIALHSMHENHRLIEQARMEDEMATRRSLDYEDRRQLPAQQALQPNLYSVLQGMPGRMRYDPLARVLMQPNPLPQVMDPGMFVMEEEKFSHVKEAVQKAGVSIARGMFKEAMPSMAALPAATGASKMMTAASKIPNQTASYSATGLHRMAKSMEGTADAMGGLAKATQDIKNLPTTTGGGFGDMAAKAVAKTRANPWTNAGLAVGGLAGAAALSSGGKAGLEYMNHEVTPAQSLARRQAANGFVPASSNAYGEALQQPPNLLSTAGGWR